MPWFADHRATLAADAERAFDDADSNDSSDVFKLSTVVDTLMIADDSVWDEMDSDPADSPADLPDSDDVSDLSADLAITDDFLLVPDFNDL